MEVEEAVDDPQALPSDSDEESGAQQPSTSQQVSRPSNTPARPAAQRRARPSPLIGNINRDEARGIRDEMTATQREKVGAIKEIGETLKLMNSGIEVLSDNMGIIAEAIAKIADKL